jgi:hypothetical protein
LPTMLVVVFSKGFGLYTTESVCKFGYFSFSSPHQSHCYIVAKISI